MVPIRIFSGGFTDRASDSIEKIEPFTHYYFICEGANTESWYFKKLINLKSSLSIHAMIKIRYLDKTQEHANLSDPNQLVEFAKKLKDEGIRNAEAGIEGDETHISFDKEIDKMVVVFDADVFERKKTNYHEILEYAAENDLMLAVTNPSFELFLLLHREDSYRQWILPNESEIIANGKVGNKRFISSLFTDVFGINSKRNSTVEELAADVKVAIRQEREINQDISCCKGKLTSNIGEIIESLMDD